MWSKRALRIGVVVGVVNVCGLIAWSRKESKPKETGRAHIGGVVKRVAVIGGGVSGVVATKWLVEYGHEVKTFEQSNGIGGNWRYILEGEDSSSCYQNLSAITSARSMSFEGHPVPKKYGMFPHHAKIYEYLKYYCDINHLWDHFVLNTKVMSVSPTEGGYNVTYLRNGVEKTESFDAVAVCNGHNSQPYLPPSLEDELKQFSGTVLHSRSYRYPKQFKGKNVLILGGGISGKQIAFDISSKAHLVAISTRRPLNVSEVYKGKTGWFQLAKLTGSTIQIVPSVSRIFNDGRAMEFDAIIVCTGYQNQFPFLDRALVDPIVRFPEGSTHPLHLHLFKHTFPIPSGESKTPTLAFIGMMDVVDSSMFSVADTQAKWFAQLLADQTRLPPPQQMNDDTEAWLRSVNLLYHPMAISSPSLFREQITKLIEENKT